VITLREIIALIFFGAALALTAEFFFEGLIWIYLAGAAFCFALAHWTWPSKKRGQREQDNWFLDLLEVVIEFPVEAIVWCFRILGRTLRNKDGGVDLDL